MKTLFSGRSDMPFAMLLLAPSLILLGGLVAWPMISNIEISFLRLPLNPRIDAVFVGLDNYIRILGDAAFLALAVDDVLVYGAGRARQHRAGACRRHLL